MRRCSAAWRACTARCRSRLPTGARMSAACGAGRPRLQLPRRPLRPPWRALLTRSASRMLRIVGSIVGRPAWDTTGQRYALGQQRGLRAPDRHRLPPMRYHAVAAACCTTWQHGQCLQEVMHLVPRVLVRQAEASLAHVEAREAALSAQLAGAAGRARLAGARLARLRGELAARHATLAHSEDEAAQLGQARPCSTPPRPPAARASSSGQSSPPRTPINAVFQPPCCSAWLLCRTTATLPTWVRSRDCGDARQCMLRRGPFGYLLKVHIFFIITRHAGGGGGARRAGGTRQRPDRRDTRAALPRCPQATAGSAWPRKSEQASM